MINISRFTTKYWIHERINDCSYNVVFGLVENIYGNVLRVAAAAATQSHISEYLNEIIDIQKNSMNVNETSTEQQSRKR